MSEETKKIEAVIENDKDYEDILEKFDNPKESASPSKKKNGHIKALFIAIAALVIVVGAGAALIFAPKSNDNSDDFKGPATVKNEVKNNVHEVQIKKNKNGKIKENGSGTFLSKVPSDIKKIHVKNTSSEYTVNAYTPKKKTKETDPKTGKAKYKTETTVYKISGYENFKLQDGIADELASSCSTLKFSSISSDSDDVNLADFGFDKPRATVTVTYTDNTKATFKVGKDAAQNLGTYIMFGNSKTVFLCEKDAASKFLYSINDHISKTINDSAADSTKSEAQSVTLSGSKFSRNVTFTANPDKKYVSVSYIITSPVQTYADDSETSTVTGAIRGLMAESVAAVNPSSSKISSLGLKTPYVKIDAKYSDTTVSLLASKPDSKGNCYLMKSGGNIIYNMKMASIPWVNTTEKKLISPYVFKPELSTLKKMSVTIKNETYDFDIKTTETKSKDDKGEETTSTDTQTSYNNEKLNEGYFETYFNNLALLQKADKYGSSASGSPTLSVKYSYSDSRSADTVSFYKSGSKYIARVNSKSVGTVYSNYIEKFISQTSKVIKNKEVKTFY